MVWKKQGHCGFWGLPTVFTFLLLQGLGPYSNSIKNVEKEIKEMAKKVNDLCGMF